MRRLVVAVLLSSLAVPMTAFAVGKEKVMYVGGTVPNMAPKSDGVLSTTDTEKLMFVAENGGILEVPWTRIQELEYGQKAGRKVKEAILLSPVFLFSKKRQHFLTVSYKDKEGKDQAAIFELGKAIVRTTLTIIETRSGRKVTFQDEEAAKARSN